jgi:hypothetical protein
MDKDEQITRMAQPSKEFSGFQEARRTWVDLTRTQMQDVYFEVLKEHRGGHQMEGQLAFGEALQAKLKERNT